MFFIISQSCPNVQTLHLQINAAVLSYNRNKRKELKLHTHFQAGKNMGLDKNSIIKLLLILSCIVIIFTSLSRLLGGGNNISLSDYASENPELAYADKATPADAETEARTQEDTEAEKASQADAAAEKTSQLDDGPEATTSSGLPLPEAEPLTGASLNGSTLEEERITYAEGFYYEPLSDRLRRYITGVSYPQETEDAAIGFDGLRYLHIRHIDFDGNPAEGELICNEAIAQDLVEIFYELYRNEYALERVRLIDEYDGDDSASMEDNNTSCFNYRIIAGSDKLSKHALGLAVDINPLYNPQVTYQKDGSALIAPASAQPYTDRSVSFPYKIDDTDLCYKLFLQHGFTWGGNWNTGKDYQHFQKAVE